MNAAPPRRRPRSASRARQLLAVALPMILAAPLPGRATEFSVTPIRVELKPGAMSETITVINHEQTRLRVSVKLMEWTQDATGQDVYSESNDLIYFPRQLDLAPDSKRLIRVGVKVPAGTAERTYRLFVEEEPDPTTTGARAQVAFHFRFGVPIFMTPAVGKPVPEVLPPTMEKGKLTLVVKNSGNQHFRLNKLSVTDGASFVQELPGWYSLAGTARSYVASVPREVCVRTPVLSVLLEGEGIALERKLTVNPAHCA